jgi:peptide-methionine (S)-S-oxide reductase
MRKLLVLSLFLTLVSAAGGEARAMSESDSKSEDPTALRATATLGGGCFWCLEAVFEELEGVEDVISGYAGGHKPSPSYAEVCGGGTGHAEVVQIVYDPSVLSYEELLTVFFSIHDPTTPDRQGADMGSQYRSIILYQDEAQKKAAESLIAQLDDAGIWDRPIVTEVAPLEKFYRAETYHQDYFARNPDQPYCVAVVEPKLEKFRKKFHERLKR